MGFLDFLFGEAPNKVEAGAEWFGKFYFTETLPMFVNSDVETIGRWFPSIDSRHVRREVTYFYCFVVDYRLSIIEQARPRSSPWRAVFNRELGRRLTIAGDDPQQWVERAVLYSKALHERGPEGMTLGFSRLVKMGEPDLALAHLCAGLFTETCKMIDGIVQDAIKVGNA